MMLFAKASWPLTPISLRKTSTERLFLKDLKNNYPSILKDQPTTQNINPQPARPVSLDKQRRA